MGQLRGKIAVITGATRNMTFTKIGVDIVGATPKRMWAALAIRVRTSRLVVANEIAR
jgi:hypothetical protein